MAPDHLPLLPANDGEPPVTTWTVLSVDRVIDGDSVRLRRTRELGEGDGFIFTVTDRRPIAARLLWVDTPEIGQDGWAQAKADLERWIDDTRRVISDRLIAVDHGPDNFGRRLTDLQDEIGNSASQYLIRDCGWPPYVEDK